MCCVCDPNVNFGVPSIYFVCVCIMSGGEFSVQCFANY